MKRQYQQVGGGFFFIKISESKFLRNLAKYFFHNHISKMALRIIKKNCRIVSKLYIYLNKTVSPKFIGPFFNYSLLNVKSILFDEF